LLIGKNLFDDKEKSISPTGLSSDEDRSSSIETSALRTNSTKTQQPNHARAQPKKGTKIVFIASHG